MASVNMKYSNFYHVNIHKTKNGRLIIFCHCIKGCYMNKITESYLLSPISSKSYRFIGYRFCKKKNNNYKNALFEIANHLLEPTEV